MNLLLKLLFLLTASVFVLGQGCARSHNDDDGAGGEGEGTHSPTPIVSASNPPKAPQAAEETTPSNEPVRSVKLEDGNTYPVFRSSASSAETMSSKYPSDFVCMPKSATVMTSKNGAEVRYECMLENLDGTSYAGNWFLIEFTGIKRSLSVETIETQEIPGRAAFSFGYPSALFGDIRRLTLAVEVQESSWVISASPLS